MKQLSVILIALCCLFFTPVIAAATNGKIIDIFGEGIITVQINGKHSFAPGDKIDLTYMAGVLPMAIGQYQITTAKGDILLGKPVALNMPANNGMKVEINLAKKGADAALVQNGLTKLKTTSAAVTVDPNRVLNGKVSAVTGDDIKIDLEGKDRPQVGWVAELFYVTSKGKELPVGAWKVEAVNGASISASKFKGVGNARVGLKAVLSSGQKKQLAKPAPVKKPVIPVATTQAPQKQPAAQPIQLLGTRAPVASPKKTATNAVPKNPHKLPPGVKKNPKTKKHQLVAKGPEVVRLVEILKSSNLSAKRNVAKAITRNPDQDPLIYQTANDQLLKSYQTANDKLEVDTMAWLCKALAASGNLDYKETLHTVSKSAKNRKLKKYAKKSYDQLR